MSTAPSLVDLDLLSRNSLDAYASTQTDTSGSAPAAAATDGAPTVAAGRGAAQPSLAVPGAHVRAAVLRRAAMVVLAAVAAAGAVLSFSSLYTAAVPVFGPVLAAGFPLLVDALCLGASLAYAAGATVGRPRAGWRLTAHAAAAGTIALNALAAHRVADVPWHVTAPATWSVLVELTARELLGTWRATHTTPRDQIPARLWLTAPIESTRTWLLMARTGTVTHAGARIDVGVHAAAAQALHLALPGRRARRVRAVLRRQLRAGSLPPSAVLRALGWATPDGSAAVSSTSAPAAVSPTAALRTALAGVLADRTRPRPADAVHSGDPGDAPHSPASTQRLPASSPDPAESRSEYTAASSSSTPVVRAAAAQGDGGRRPAAVTATVTAPSDEHILTTLTGEPPSIRSLMRTHGIGQARATRIHRAATDRHHAARPGQDHQHDEQHVNQNGQQEPNENTTEKAQHENENTEQANPTEINSRNDRD